MVVSNYVGVEKAIHVSNGGKMDFFYSEPGKTVSRYHRMIMTELGFEVPHNPIQTAEQLSPETQKAIREAKNEAPFRELPGFSPAQPGASEWICIANSRVGAMTSGESLAQNPVLKWSQNHVAVAQKTGTKMEPSW